MFCRMPFTAVRCFGDDNKILVLTSEESDDPAPAHVASCFLHTVLSFYDQVSQVRKAGSLVRAALPGEGRVERRLDVISSSWAHVTHCLGQTVPNENVHLCRLIIPKRAAWDREPTSCRVPVMKISSMS